MHPNKMSTYLLSCDKINIFSFKQKINQFGFGKLKTHIQRQKLN